MIDVCQINPMSGICQSNAFLGTRIINSMIGTGWEKSRKLKLMHRY